MELAMLLPLAAAGWAILAGVLSGSFTIAVIVFIVLKLMGD
jgi:hypothetical protein